MAASSGRGQSNALEIRVRPFQPVMACSAQACFFEDFGGPGPSHLASLVRLSRLRTSAYAQLQVARARLPWALRVLSWWAQISSCRIVLTNNSAGLGGARVLLIIGPVSASSRRFRSRRNSQSVCRPASTMCARASAPTMASARRARTRSKRTLSSFASSMESTKSQAGSSDERQAASAARSRPTLPSSDNSRPSRPTS
jgi:hypothetical protein